MLLIDGKKIAATINSETAQQVDLLKQRGITPGLAVVLVGSHPASMVYVRNKDKTAGLLGFNSRKIELPESTSETELLAQIHRLNQDPAVHGILVQSPLPAHIKEQTVVLALEPGKDVDGFHPINVGKLAQGDPTALIPCTPLGCQELLLRSDIPITGAHVVVLGRSLLVGRPIASLLLNRGRGGDATVTVAHSKTRSLPEITRSADILIAAIGQPEFVRADFVREGVVVIDVGINRLTDPQSGKTRLTGDVAFAEVAAKASAISPVPGGVGPMTIAMLMANTLRACQLRSGI